MQSIKQAVFQKFNLQEDNLGAFLANKWVGDKSKILMSISPIDNSILAKIYQPTESEVKSGIQDLHINFQRWKNVPAPKRANLVQEIANRIKEHKTLLAQLITMEMGKGINESLGEVQEMIDMADFAIGQSRMLYGKTMPSERPNHRLIELWQPLGVNLIITAFNFPMAVWSWNAFLSLVCGNTILWKPSSLTPLCALAIQHICNKAMTTLGYEGVIAMAACDNKIIENLLSDKNLALTSFTGSTNTGKKVNQLVAARLGKVILELGGNNAVIVDKDANLSLALRAVCFGALGTTGQRCTTTRRVFVHSSLYDEFLDKLINVYKTVKVGDPLDKSNFVGPLVNLNSVEDYKKALKIIHDSNECKVLIGGKVIDKDGCYVEPTLVECKSHNFELTLKETFVPIVYIFKFEDYKEVMVLHNKVTQGLSSAVFTNNIKSMEYFLSPNGSDCGIANVNVGTSGAEIGGAFGGEKDTGGGRESGSDAWKQYMRRQTVTINGGDELPLAQGIEFNV